MKLNWSWDWLWRKIFQPVIEKFANQMLNRLQDELADKLEQYVPKPVFASLFWEGVNAIEDRLNMDFEDETPGR